jgi:GNAT superfamily N-acetyltransferase
MAAVRPARPADRADVVATVVAAFTGDPAWGWFLGSDFDRLAPAFAGALFDRRVGAGHVWITGAAGAEVLERLDHYDDAVHAAGTSAPHWYLGVLATRPGRAGTGLATAVLEPVLRQADIDGVGCCLETSTLANRAFYARRGFVDVTEVDIVSGPEPWWLRRPPRKPPAHVDDRAR